VAEGRIENTAPFRFSLDESLTSGGAPERPVIDEYDTKMPFKFTGTLNKVEIKLGAHQLSPDKRGELKQLQKGFCIAGPVMNRAALVCCKSTNGTVRSWHL